MSFKDQIANDIYNIFLNLDEFAEPVDIDGVFIDAVMDDNMSDKPDMGTLGMADFADGVYRKGIHLFVAADKLGYEPSARRVMYINHKPYIVMDVSNDMGMYEILLEVNDY